jgi:hypothetical protein
MAPHVYNLRSRRSFRVIARVWDVRLDEGTLEQWSTVVDRSPYVLLFGTHVRRVLLHLESQSSKAP